MSRLPRVVVPFIVVLLGGCVTQSLIRKPPAGTQNNPAKVSNPVLVELNWSGIKDAYGTPSMSLDGVDRTSALVGSGQQQASATFTLMPGPHDLWAAISINSSLYPQHTETLSFEVIGPGFALDVNPSKVQIPPGGSANAMVTLKTTGGFNGAVTITASALPASLSQTITPPGASTQWQIAFGAQPTAATTSVTDTITGSGPCSPNCSGTLTSSVALTVEVPPPTLTSASPNVQARGASVTVKGANFSTDCSRNTVTVAGVSNVMTANCSNSSLTFTVPTTAVPGATQLFVFTNGTKSNSIGFTVARQPGSFVEISNDIVGQVGTSRLCSTGTVRLDVCPPNCPGHPVGAYVATFNNVPGAVIGATIEFRRNSSSVSGLGGAGFSFCSVGIVLDGDASGYTAELMALKFLDLQSGANFLVNPYPFNYYPPGSTTGYSPRVFRSPDGTLILVVAPANVGPAKLTAGFIDAVSGKLIKQESISTATMLISATVTSNNQISLTADTMTFPLISIP